MGNQASHDSVREGLAHDSLVSGTDCQNGRSCGHMNWWDAIFHWLIKVIKGVSILKLERDNAKDLTKRG